MTSPTELENELYAGLPEAVKKELSSRGEAQTRARGTRLVQKGVLPEGVIILTAGAAETTVTVAGKEMSLGVAGPGRVFALHSVITGAPPDTTVTCRDDCKITMVAKDAFLEQLKRHPEMYFAVVRVLSTDLANADRLIRECARGFQPKSSNLVRPA